MMFLASIFTVRSPDQLSGTIPIDAPTSSESGHPITITIGPVNARDGLPVGLLMIGSSGPTTYFGKFNSGKAQFIIPGETTSQLGYLTLIVAAENARGNASVILYHTDRDSAGPT